MILAPGWRPVSYTHLDVYKRQLLLRQTVRRYADLLPFPILLNGTGPINAINAPWHEPGWRDPVERDRLLTAFLSQRYACLLYTSRCV